MLPIRTSNASNTPLCFQCAHLLGFNVPLTFCTSPPIEDRVHIYWIRWPTGYKSIAGDINTRKRTISTEWCTAQHSGHLYPFHTRNLGRPECAFIARSVRHGCTHFIPSRDECGVEKAPSNLPLPQVWWRDECAFMPMRLQSRSSIIMWTTMALSGVSYALRMTAHGTASIPIVVIKFVVPGLLSK